MSFLLLPLIGFGTVMFLTVLWGLINIVPGLSLVVRRLRDAGFHWAFIFLSLIPAVGSLIILILCCLPTKASKEDEQIRLLREIRDLQKEQNEKDKQ